MADISIEEALRLPAAKPKKKRLSIEEALAAPTPPAPTPAPGLGTAKNLGLGVEQEVYGSFLPAAITTLEALGSAMTGDFGPAKEIGEQALRGAAPIVSALGSNPALAAQNYIATAARQAPAINAIARQRAERQAGPITGAVERARQEVEAEAAQDPSLRGRVTRGVGRFATAAAPAVVTGALTGGSVPAMAGVAAIQSMNAPEMLVPNVALAATPIPVGRAITPIVRRIKAGRAAAEAIPVPPAAPEIPAISPETPLPGVEAPSVLPTPALNPALASAVQKLGTDSIDEIAEMIANANRRFNKTITKTGAKKRPLTPAERRSAIEDYERVSSLTKAENEALSEVLPERTFSPVGSAPVEGEPTARAISDIPLDEPNAQLDANLRALKAFFDSESAAAESRISAALEGPPLSKAAMSVAGGSASGPRAGAVSPMEMEIGSQLNEASRPSGFRRALNIAADIYNIPRAILSSGDISAPFRQGAILSLPPSRWGKALRSSVEMFRALVPDKPTSIKGGIKAQFQPKTERFQRMIDAIASDPDAQAGQSAGLHLGTQSRGPLRKAEEEFVSRTADRIPIVRESQQAYTAYLDNIRLNTFKEYKRAIDAGGFSKEQTERAYKAAADWINIASGRGSFGPKLDKAMDALNFFIFSPRLLASRIQVLNPATYLKNATTAEGRVVLKKQMAEMSQFTGMVASTLLLAKAAGFKVGTNPEKPNFLRISLGNYHYDGLAGLQPVMRLIWNVGADAVRAAQGEKPVTGGRDALDVAARFLRGKAAPVPSFFVDFLDRKTFEGKPFDLTQAAVERMTPIMWQDFIEAYQREGLGGPLMLAPGAVGIGAQYFEPKPIDAAIEQRPGLLTELTRLQIRIADPRRKPEESDKAYKDRQEAVASLYGRFGPALMSSREYANLPDTTKQEVFDLLHSRIIDAVNTRDRRTAQFQAPQLINSLRKSATQKTIRERLVSRRPPL